MAAACCESSFSLFSDWVIPEGILQRRLGSFYAKNPVMSRIIATPLAFIAGTAKVLLFPVMCVVGIVALPIIAIVRKEACSSWLGAWAFCLLGTLASAAFVISFGYHMPLLYSSGLFIAFVSISIAAHVHAYVKEPAPAEYTC